MKKKFVFLLVSTLLMGSMSAVAQDDVDPNAPPKVAYRFDFEDAPEKDNYNTEVLTIGGKRWKLHNARIVNSTTQGVPQGRKAVEILGDVVDGEPATLELLDPIVGNTIALAFTHSGMDRVISRSRSAWQLQATFDGGATWAEQPLGFDNKDVPALFTVQVPARDNAEYRFRVIYTGALGIGKNWRLLVDDIMVMKGNGYNIPWYVQPGRLGDGFCTAESSISFVPILNGATWWFGPQDFKCATTYLEMKIDDRAPVKYYEMPEDIVFKAEELAEGPHHMTIRFMNRDGNVVWDDALQADLDFNVCPITPIKGISNLRQAEVGKFYELTPNGNDSIFINWREASRAQKWLFDGKDGILVDDPNYLDYSETTPESQVVVKTMRGQLLKVDNNLIFRLDRKPEVEVIASNPFHFLNFILDDASLLDNGAYAGCPLALTGMRFKKDVSQIDGDPNGRIEVVDAQGREMILQNIYSHNFKKIDLMALPADKSMTIFGIVGRTFIDNKVCVFPLSAMAEEATGIGNVQADEGKDIQDRNEGGSVRLSSAQHARVRHERPDGSQLRARRVVGEPLFGQRRSCGHCAIRGWNNENG